MMLSGHGHAELCDKRLLVFVRAEAPIAVMEAAGFLGAETEEAGRSSEPTLARDALSILMEYEHVHNLL